MVSEPNQDMTGKSEIERAKMEKAIVEASTTSKTVAPKYQLAANENPRGIIAQVKFTGENFDEWAQAIRTALRVKKKFGFVDGSNVRPKEDSEEFEDWVAASSMVALWILNTIEPNVRRTLSNKEDPLELWMEIKTQFSEGNGPRIQEIKAELANCRQGGMTVIEYFGKLKMLWEDMMNYDVSPVCSCGNCTCNMGVKLEKKKEDDKIHQFLLGLDDDIYGAVRTSIVTTDPMPTMNQVYAKIKSVERLRSVVRNREQTTTQAAFAVRTSSSGGNVEEKTKLVCSNCKKTGHLADNCFQIIGFPEWWGEKSRQGGRGGRGGGRGRGGFARANAVTTHGSGETSAEAERSGYTGLSNEQWTSLIKLLEDQKQDANKGTRLSGKNDSLEWVLDTGATNHMTGSIDNLTNLRYMLPCLIGLPNGKQTVSKEKGTIFFDEEFSLKNVLFVPDLKCNLISVSQLIEELDLVMQIANKGCVIQDRLTRNLTGAGELRNGLYFFRRLTSFSAFKMNKEGAEDVWHQRLGHPSNTVFDLFSSVGSRHKDFSACDVCLRSKQCRETFYSSDNKGAGIFDMIHVDLWGPYRSPSVCNSYYFLTIVDDYSRGVWVYLLHDKAQVGKTLMNFMALVLRQFEKKVKVVRSDNGTEFMCLGTTFAEQGIIHQTSCVGTPQQNGRVERKHRHILNVARSLLFQSSLPVKFWGEAILAAGYLINRTPSSVLQGKTPYEILYGTVPTYENLRVFGCLAFAHNQKRDGDKFASRSRRCVFLGYPFGKKGWTLFDLDKEELFVSRDVLFVEDSFPFRKENSKPVSFDLFDEDIGEGSDLPDKEDTPAVVVLDEVVQEESVPVLEKPAPIVGEIENSGDVKTTAETVAQAAAETDVGATADTDVGAAAETDVGAAAEIVMETVAETDLTERTEQLIETEELGKGLRKKQVPVKLKDYVLHHVSTDLVEVACVNDTEEAWYPISKFDTLENFSDAHCAFLVAVTNGKEPMYFRDAVAFREWRDAMGLEVDALEKNKTWDMTELPAGKTAIGSMWVYKIKYNSDGSIERYKARLVALGNKQVEGVDYSETFAPVVKMSTVKMFLAVASAKNWELHQMDVHNAFLHGDLEEEVYMKPPPGFRCEGKNLVCRLKKSLYGLRQSPRCWFAKLNEALVKYGFKHSYGDYSLFTLRTGKFQLYVLVYVDDLIIGGDDSDAIQRFKQYLGDCFHMKDLGHLKYFLGIEIARRKEGIFMCQRKYALDIVTEMGLLGTKPANTPMEEQHKLGLSESELLEEPARYRRLVGRLIYLGATRPDLTYAVHVLSTFMSQPRNDHWNAALRVVRYLKGTLGQGIFLNSDCDLRLHGWCDADWGGCLLTRRSLTGWLITLGKSPVTWKTMKQDVVSHSSAESEYRSMSESVRELKWLRSLLNDFGVHQSEAMELYCDNQAAIYIAANPVFHERTKQVEMDCHSVRDEVKKGAIRTMKVSTTEQIADIFTKALCKRQFDYLLAKLGVSNPHAPT